MATTTAICVWLDSDSQGYDPAWIVSLDELLLPQGHAETTDTLHVCDTEDEAMDLARKEAARRDLPLYRNPNGKPAELVEG